MNMQNILHNHARHAALFPLCNDFCSTVCYYFVKYFRKDRGIVTRQKKKRLIISCAIAAAVAAALLLYLMPRRVDSAMHLPAASEDVQSVNLVKYISVFAPEPTLHNWQYTLDRQTDTALMEEALHWLYSARLRCPLPSDGSLNSSVAATYTLFVFADGCDTEAILLSGDGYAVVGSMRYRVSQKDMAGLVLLFDHLSLSEE
mgnify:FL=1